MAGKAILVISVIFGGTQPFKREWRMFADMFYIFYKFVRRWTDNLVETGNWIGYNKLDMGVQKLDTVI